jgi:hypothetical protein
MFGGAGRAGNASGSSGSERSARGTTSDPFSRFMARWRKRGKVLMVIAIIVIIAILAFGYWWFHPALNIHNADVWWFVGIIILLPTFIVLWTKHMRIKHGDDQSVQSMKKSKRFKWFAMIPVLIVLVGILGFVTSLSLFPGNAERYASILQTQDGDFATDIPQVDYSQIPVIDKASAQLLGSRTMGSMADYVSQFEIDPIYSQINYHGAPVRVSPLNYADFFKWMSNSANGIPAYVIVNMTTQETDVVRLDDPIRFVNSDPFADNVDRHVQLTYPTYMFDQKSFEIDESGHPWWIYPVQDYTIGLFGGTTISRVVMCDACTGECTDLAIGDVPEWVDRAYPSDLLVQQYNWSGSLSGGWINSWLGQSGVKQTTPGSNGSLGYNYIAKDDDVWLYTGVTSATNDNSIIGFVLINQRTAESHFYTVAGATEESAMNSAEGQVQNLGYQATFPLLLNINSQPTYFMALKDNAGLVKQYAMLDVQRYQNVATGDTVANCQVAYTKLLAQNGVNTGGASAGGSGSGASTGTLSATGTIRTTTTAVVDGATHIYITLTGDNNIYDCAIPDVLDAVRYIAGDKVTIQYRQGTDTQTVQSITAAG